MAAVPCAPSFDGEYVLSNGFYTVSWTSNCTSEPIADSLDTATAFPTLHACVDHMESVDVALHTSKLAHSKDVGVLKMGTCTTYRVALGDVGALEVGDGDRLWPLGVHENLHSFDPACCFTLFARPGACFLAHECHGASPIRRHMISFRCAHPPSAWLRALSAHMEAHGGILEPSAPSSWINDIDACANPCPLSCRKRADVDGKATGEEEGDSAEGNFGSRLSRDGGVFKVMQMRAAWTPPVSNCDSHTWRAKMIECKHEELYVACDHRVGLTLQDEQGFTSPLDIRRVFGVELGHGDLRGSEFHPLSTFALLCTDGTSEALYRLTLSAVSSAARSHWLNSLQLYLWRAHAYLIWQPHLSIDVGATSGHVHIDFESPPSLDAPITSTRRSHSREVEHAPDSFIPSFDELTRCTRVTLFIVFGALLCVLGVSLVLAL